MPMRSSSLANNPLAITRELDGKYDVVLEVRDNLDLIDQVAGIDFAAILAELESAQDFTGITVVQGETVAWDAVNKILTVPKGDKGDKGDVGDTGLTGPQGIQGTQGIKGNTGLKGDAGSQGPKGFTGDNGAQGPKGDTGDDLTISQITYNGNGTFNWLFSDGTVYVTPSLKGPKGDTGNQGVKGDQGISVHHIKGTSTTDGEGDFGAYGEIDTYTVYGDANETINLGFFRVNNGAAKEGQHGPMYKSTYDTTANGIVDNSEKLEGRTIAQIQADITDTIGASNGIASLDATTKLERAQVPTMNVTLEGDVSGNFAVDGSLNTTVNVVVQDNSHSHTFSNLTANPTTLSGYGITDTYTKTETNTQISTAVNGLATTADVANAIVLGGRDVYLGSYGLTWNETTDTYRRIGAANYTAIQSMMKRCVLNADGSVNYYLSATDSNYKADGTAADLTGASGNVMVEIPKFYIGYGYTTTGGGGSDTVHSWEISQTPDTGFVEHWAFTRGASVAKRYYPAYQGYSTGSKLISRSGVYPTVAQTLGQFRTLSKANSITNPSTGQTVNGYWGNIDFALYEAITLLMIIEYGTMDIQSALGKGRTMLSGGSWVGSELIGATGLSNAFGNGTANYTYTGLSTDTSADLSFMSYRGCENFFGNVWRMADGVIFLGTTNNKSMWFSTNPSTFNDTASGYTQVAGVSTASSSGYGRKLASTDKGFIITDVAGGTSGNSTTDCYYTSTTDVTVALVGGSSSGGLPAGPLGLSVRNSAASFSDVGIGCGVSF